MKEPIISFRNFGFRYKEQKNPTLHDIDLDIYPGEKILILGASGSGKSTLCNCINGLIPFSYEGEITGTCTVNGTDTSTASIFKLSDSVGTVLQDTDAQFVGLSVGEDIAFSMENDMIPRAEMLPVIEKNASMVGMQNFIDHVPFNLSGGQKQKVAIAGVFGNDVEILIFDEPLASLDPQMGMTAVELIDDISKETGKTIIIIEHRLEDVLHRPVDRIILMADGRIAADMSPDDLLRSSLLSEYGIREPLYLTAMKYAGCSLEDSRNLSDLTALELTPENEEKLKAFFTEERESVRENTNEPVVTFRDVSYSYNSGRKVLRDINFEIRRGERIAIIGRNGAGKSTAAKLLCGIIRPDTGTITLEGTDTSTLSVKEIGEKVGYVMQDPNTMIVKDLIKDEVGMALGFRDIPQEEAERRVNTALETCGLYRMRNWPVDAVSYGQKKRVTVASMMALEPDVFVLDEPTAGQDYRSYTEIMKFVNTLNREYGKTILFITHDMHLAIENTDRAIVFSDGELIASDKVFAVLADADVIERASLKQTSLYTLAVKLGLEPESTIRHFIEYEREMKADE
ncbi:MAG: ABC transporter ATP-binding protein [Oscillospiraceae bacterium]|nr:ABC transporter ATP-binding protein [Oscillospiraceae bacterium]MBR5065864.1 ABC transporter ATP-binding protein [Oscillospiraceae bacterium]